LPNFVERWSCAVTDGLDRTWTILANTPNQAAVPVLLSALTSRHSEIRMGAIRSLVLRRSVDGHAEIIRRFESFRELEQLALTQAIHQSTHQMKTALRDAVLAEHAELCESACHIIVLGKVYDMLPTLVKAAENRSHRHSDQAAATLVQLALLMHQEISGESAERTCDPFFMRRQVLTSLERSLTIYQAHRRVEIVDAFLLLVTSDNATLSKILDDPRDPCHQPIVASLSTSAVTSVLDLLTQFLQDTRVPGSVLSIIAKRQDRKFLNHMLGRLGLPLSLRVAQNMKRLTSITWLQQGREVLPQLDGQAQAVAAELAAASALDRAAVFQLLAFLLKMGAPDGRRASCDALATFSEPPATQLILGALGDSHPSVKAAAARQLRRRQAPGAMEKLVAMLDSPSPEVRDAARSSLSEFSFARYQASFDGLDTVVRGNTGKLVRKVDPNAVRRLSEMLSSASITVKRRGLEMAMAMGAADDVCEQLIILADDQDLGVRAHALTALGYCTRSAAKAALRKAEHDQHRSVYGAARASLEQLDIAAPDNEAVSGSAQS
jgi:HEAT repeat protein